MLTFIFTFQKSFTFGDPFMEKQSDWFTIAKMCKQRLKKEEILSKMTCVFAENVTLRLEFSVSAGANQPHGFSICGISAPNGLI